MKYNTIVLQSLFIVLSLLCSSVHGIPKKLQNWQATTASIGVGSGSFIVAELASNQDNSVLKSLFQMIIGTKSWGRNDLIVDGSLSSLLLSLGVGSLVAWVTYGKLWEQTPAAQKKFEKIVKLHQEALEAETEHKQNEVLKKITQRLHEYMYHPLFKTDSLSSLSASVEKSKFPLVMLHNQVHRIYEELTLFFRDLSSFDIPSRDLDATLSALDCFLDDKVIPLLKALVSDRDYKRQCDEYEKAENKQQEFELKKQEIYAKEIQASAIAAQSTVVKKQQEAIHILSEQVKGLAESTKCIPDNVHKIQLIASGMESRMNNFSYTLGQVKSDLEKVASMHELIKKLDRESEQYKKTAKQLEEKITKLQTTLNELKASMAQRLGTNNQPAYNPEAYDAQGAPLYPEVIIHH